MQAEQFEFGQNDGWMYIVNRQSNKPRRMLFEQEYLKPDFGTSGKYMIFSDNFPMLLELGQKILSYFSLHHAKISLVKSSGDTGFGHSLCVFDFGPHYKKEIKTFIGEELPIEKWEAENSEKPYPFNYRYWKYNKATADGEYSWQYIKSSNVSTFTGTDIDSFRTGPVTLPKDYGRPIYVPGMPLTLNDLLGRKPEKDISHI